MPWNIEDFGDGQSFIEDRETVPGSRVLIGSIVKKPDDGYHVEIMRFTGDVTGDFAGYNEALAFVQGVEKSQDKENNLDRLFEMRWKSEQRAIERWRAAHPNENYLVWPDRADMVLWLMEEYDRLKTAILHSTGEMPELYDIAKKLCHENGMDWTDPRSGVTHKAPKT